MPLLLSGRLTAAGLALGVALTATQACSPWGGSRRDMSRALSAGSASGFHVVLITLDTTRADRLGAYGYAKAETPVLDRLARQGVRYADAVSCAPLTLTAHASILTGLDPQNHGVRHNGQYRLDPSHVSLAELLRERGYETAAFVSAFVLDARYGLNQGFGVYDDRVEPASGQSFGGLDSQRSAGKVTDAAIEWLLRRGTRKGEDSPTGAKNPFFLWVHYYDPHAEYLPPGDYASRFQASPYDGEIAYMDSQIGRLMGALESTGEKRLVFVVADHGESLGEHEEYTHSRLIYDSTQRVPLVLWSPALFQGPYVVEDAVVGIIDIFPTVLELLDITYEGAKDGISLLRGREVPDRAIYMETMAPYLENGWAPLYGVRRHQDKYILAPRPEYYDLRADPKERENLHGRASGRPAEAVVRLREELEARVKEGPSEEAVAAAAAKPDPETLRRLQALGYLSGAGPLSSIKPAGSLPDPKDMMPVQNLLIEARASRAAQRLNEALAKVREALERAPKDLEALQEAGLVYIEMDRLEEAEGAFRKYISLKPNPNINILLSQILSETARGEEAEALLKQAMELEPDHGGVMITFGDFLVKQGKYEEAMRWYQKAKQVDPYRASATADKRIVGLRRRLGGG